MFSGGIRPHMFCLPILKHENHRQALLEAIASGSRKFFAGTDSAPHLAGDKESCCGCAGIFTAHAALELYAEAFDQAGALDKLPSFLCHNGADFYGLPRNKPLCSPRKIVRKKKDIPDYYKVKITGGFGVSRLVPLRAGESVNWEIQ